MTDLRPHKRYFAYEYLLLHTLISFVEKEGEIPEILTDRMVVEISQRNSTTAWTASPTKRGIFCLLLGVMYAITQRNNR